MAQLTSLVLLALLGGAQADWVQQEPDVRPYSNELSMWVLEKPTPEDHPVTLTVALKLDDDRRAMLEKTFWEVSDPKHEKYGKHLSIDDVTKILAIPDDQVDTVRTYFLEAGATTADVAPNKDMITVTMPAAAAQKALKTSLGFFTHSQRPEVRIVRSTSTYSLPMEIAKHVSLVGELLQFPRLRLPELMNLQGTGYRAAGTNQWPNACSVSNCQGLVTPAVLAQRYKLPSTNASNGDLGTSRRNQWASSMAVAEFQGQGYVDSDLSGFSKSCHRDVKVNKAIGKCVIPGTEAELDIEYIKSVAPQVPLTVIYSEEYSLLDWAKQINSMSDAPLVHSVSYGNDEVQQSSKQYMETCNTAFMKAGSRGLSILFASGDQGVCGRSGCDGGFFGLHARFHPDFPAGSPYITAVGGTDFAGSEIGDETAWSDSGGGFSDTFGIPDFQKSAVAAYKSSRDADLPPSRLWNSNGRGYPDIAALGGLKAPYCIKSAGDWSGVAGTSASSPVVAGVFALLNSLRASQNKAPMGFLNPFIYQNPTAFNDVTSGINTGSTSRKYGFKAIKGWDAATGWGTPNYEALSKVVMGSTEESHSIVV